MNAPLHPETTPKSHLAREEAAIADPFCVSIIESRATRRPSLRGHGSYRGSLPLHLNGRIIEFLYESRLEADALLITSVRPDVVDMFEQAPPVTYRTADGSLRSMTPDLIVVLRDDRRILCAIKPREKAVKKDLFADLKAIAAQIPREVATHVALIDESYITKTALADATLFQAVRRDPPGEDDATLRALCRDAVGSFRVADLIARSGLSPSTAFRAMARLVCDGFLRKADGSPLSHASLVCVSKESVQ